MRNTEQRIPNTEWPMASRHVTDLIGISVGISDWLRLGLAPPTRELEAKPAHRRPQLADKSSGLVTLEKILGSLSEKG